MIAKNTNNQIYVRVSSQVHLTVTGDNIFRDLQKRVMKWAFAPERNIRSIPDGAWEGETFEVDTENSERASAIKLKKPRYWAFQIRERLRDKDRRVWTTEVGIAEQEQDVGEAVFGCRLLCSQVGMRTVPRSIPQFVRSIAFKNDAKLDGRPTSPYPWLIENKNGVDELVAFLKDPDRKHPVVVFSVPESCDDPNKTTVPVDPFLRRTVGFVHSVVLTSDASYAFTERLGGVHFSVFNQAIRTYNPDFDLEKDLWTDHPLVTTERIRGWGTDGAETFTDFLVQQALRLTRPRDVLEKEQPPFQQVKLLAVHQAREHAKNSGQSNEELVTLLEKELIIAKEEADDSLKLALAAEAEKERAIDGVCQIKASYLALQARAENLQKKLNASGEETDSIPTSFKEIKEWAERHLSGSVELHEQAIKAVTSSDFRDISLVYNALLMMRDFYVPMRQRQIEDVNKKKAYENKLAELGLEDTKCFKQDNKAKNFDGAYFVRYQGNKRRCSRNERHGFRLYYFWDAETSRVVVGHLPSHLKNDLT